MNISTEPSSVSSSRFALQPGNSSTPYTPAKDLLNDFCPKFTKLSTSPKVTKQNDGDNRTHNDVDAPTISLTLRPLKPKRHRQLPSKIDSIRSIDFDTPHYQMQVGHGSVAPSLSGIQCDLFDQNNDFTGHEDRWRFHEPKITETPSNYFYLI